MKKQVLSKKVGKLGSFCSLVKFSFIKEVLVGQVGWYRTKQPVLPSRVGSAYFFFWYGIGSVFYGLAITSKRGPGNPNTGAW